MRWAHPQHRRERDSRAQLAVAAERARIAREMHALVAHGLSVMIALNDGAAATVLQDPYEARVVNQQASAVGRQSMVEMRRLLGVLRTGEQAQLLPQPGSSELYSLIDQARAAGLPVELSVSGLPEIPAGCTTCRPPDRPGKPHERSQTRSAGRSYAGPSGLSTRQDRRRNHQRVPNADIGIGRG